LDILKRAAIPANQEKLYNGDFGANLADRSDLDLREEEEEAGTDNALKVVFVESLEDAY